MNYAEMLASLQQQPQGTGARGLMQPVVWDQFKRGMSLNNMTEGGRSMSAQGGGGSYEGKTEVREELPTDNFRQARKGYVVTDELPSGVKVKYDMYPLPDGTFGASVSFKDKNSDSYFINPKSSMRQGIDRLSEVYKSMQNFSSKVKPRVMHYSSLGPSHEKIYSKMGPSMAEGMGATYTGGDGSYSMTFPDPLTYPLKK